MFGPHHNHYGLTPSLARDPHRSLQQSLSTKPHQLLRLTQPGRSPRREHNRSNTHRATSRAHCDWRYREAPPSLTCLATSSADSRPRSPQLPHAAGLRLGNHRQRNRLRPVSAQVQPHRGIDLLAARGDRPPQLHRNLAHQQRTPMPSSQQPQIPGPQRQHRRQQFPVLLVTVGHQHHSILGSNPQHIGGGEKDDQHTLGPGNRSARANCARPSITVTLHPSSAPILTSGFASSPAPKTNSRCGATILSTNIPSGIVSRPTLPQHTCPRLHQFRLRQSATGEEEVSTRRKHRARQLSFPARQPGQHRHIFPAQETSPSRHQGSALGGIGRFQQQIDYSPAAQPKRHLRRVVKHRRVALHHGAARAPATPPSAQPRSQGIRH